MKRALLILTVLAVCSSASLAGFDFKGYTTGKFINPEGNTNFTTGIGTNHIISGVPYHPCKGSRTQLKYQNYRKFCGQLCRPFALGKMMYHNGKTVPGTQIRGISLAITATVLDPIHYQQTFVLDFDFDFKPCKDGLVMDTDHTKFKLGDTGYAIEFLGFKRCHSFTNKWYVCEGRTGYNKLWARVCPVAVPVPGSVLLSGIGLSIVGYLRKRKTL